MLSDDDFRQLLNHFDRPWAGFRKVRKGVKKRVRRHMEMLGCQTIGAYLRLIEDDEPERDRCRQYLAVTVSRFFRDRQLWEYLQNSILPALSGRFSDGLTAWSAGCAGGEEPYSLSMVWENAAVMIGKTSTLRILATDAVELCLERAEAGVYQESSLKEVSEDDLNRWFRKSGRHRRQVEAHLKKRIRWRTHQLLDVPPSGPFHLILLRNNLLTYYQGEVMETALERILGTLTAGGVLVIGSHEQLPALEFPLSRDPECHWVYHFDSSFSNSL